MDSNAGGTGTPSKSVFEGIIGTVKGVITDPVGFYRGMPKTGGFGDPLVFALVLGAIAAILQSAVTLFRFGLLGSVVALIVSVVLVPLYIVVASFIGAGILFVIWKVMGSNENYETAYRCAAYSLAIAPITAVAGLIPFVGWLVAPVWGLYLLVTASVEVHKIAAKTAWLVFGIITAVFLLMGSCASLVGRHASNRMDSVSREWQKAAKEMEKGNAEIGADATKTASAMMKMLEAQARQAKAAADKEARESGADVADEETPARAVKEAKSEAESDLGAAGSEAAKTAAAMQKMLEAQMRLARIQAEKAAKEAQAEADKAEKEANQ